MATLVITRGYFWAVKICDWSQMSPKSCRFISQHSSSSHPDHADGLEISYPGRTHPFSAREARDAPSVFFCAKNRKIIGFKWWFKKKKTLFFSVGSHPSLGTQDSAGPSEISVATSLVFLVFSWLVSYPNFFGVKYQCPPCAGESLVPITTSSCFIDSLQLSFLSCKKSLFCIFQTPVAYWCLAGNEGMIHNH